MVLTDGFDMFGSRDINSGLKMDDLGIVGALLARRLLLLVVGADLLGGLFLETAVFGQGCPVER